MQWPSCTYISAFVHELNGISLISQHLRQAFSYYTKWSAHGFVHVCVCVSLCGALANGILLIHSINSFYFLDFFFLSLDTIHLEREDLRADTQQRTADW